MDLFNPRKRPAEELDNQPEDTTQNSGAVIPDSGYASLTGTPADRVEKRHQKFPTVDQKNEATRESYKKRIWSPRNDLVCFDKDLDEIILQWSNEKLPHLEGLLVESLKSGRRLSQKYKPMAIRLMMLGENESRARPHLVVFTPPKCAAKVERFFGRPEVKESLKPLPGVPPISVVVTSYTQFLRSSLSTSSAFCAAFRFGQAQTLCGTPISTDLRKATLGGLIRVEGPNQIPRSGEDYQLLGFTVGHLFDEVEDDGTDIDSSDDERELAGSPSPDHRGVTSTRSVLPSQGEALPVKTSSWEWSSEQQVEMGHVVHTTELDVDQPCLDWCLLSVPKVLPNLVNTGSSSNPYRKADLVTPSSVLPTGEPPRSVLVLTGSCGPQEGKLVFTPGRVMLGRSESFSDAYILKLDQGTLVEGDSGSWVVDRYTNEVYGHVVGVDIFGDAYVIPMFASLQDIKLQLNATKVDLPQTVDVLTYPGFLPTTPASSPPQLPSTPKPIPDSGYATKTECTPQLRRPPPMNEEIHASIRAHLEDRPKEPKASEAGIGSLLDFFEEYQSDMGWFE